MEAPETLEALQARQRKEQRDLVSRITQKKKSASKKTRKGVNDECDRLEQELKQKHAEEIAALSGEPTEEPPVESVEEDAQEAKSDEAEKALEGLSISSTLSGTPTTAEDEQSGPKRKGNRAKARLARRAAEQDALAAQAAEEAANLPDQRELEISRMKEHFGKHGLQEKEIRADGHCLYAAVADQMETQGLKPRIQPTINGQEPAYKSVRVAAADFIAQNPDDFVPFMEEPLEEYLHKIKDTGEWGGHMELIALAKTFGIRIHVLHSDGRVDIIEPGEDRPADAKDIWLGYYKHSFGLGEHYNSLRKAP